MADANTAKTEVHQSTLEQNYTKLFHHVLTSVLTLLEKDDLDTAKNLLRNLEYPPFEDLEDLMDIVQVNTQGLFNPDIVNVEAVRVILKDSHNKASPKTKKVTKPVQVEPTKVLRSLRSKEQEQQSDKTKDGSKPKSGDGNKPKALRKGKSGVGEDSDTAKVSLDGGSSSKMSVASKLSGAKLVSVLSPKTNVQSSGTPKGKKSLRSSKPVKTSDKGLAAKKGSQKLANVESNDSEDKPLRGSKKREPNSSQPQSLLTKIEPDTEDVDSLNDFVVDKEPKKLTAKASGLTKPGRRALINQTFEIGKQAENKKSKNPAPSAVIQKDVATTAESSKNVNTRSRKANIRESRSPVSTRNQKQNEQKKGPTKVMKNKDKMVAKSSVSPKKHDTKSTRLNTKKALSGSKSPDSPSESLDNSKSNEVIDKNTKAEGNPKASQSGTVIQKSPKELVRRPKGNSSQAKTAQKRVPVVISSSSESENDSKNLGHGDAEKNVEVAHKKSRPATRSGEKDCAKRQVSVKNTKRPASKKVVSDGISSSVSLGSNDAKNEDLHSKSQESNANKGSTTEPIGSEKNSQQTNQDILTKNSGITSALSPAIKRKKAAEVSDAQDLPQTNSPSLKRIKNDTNELSGVPATSGSQPTVINSSEIPTSQDLENARGKNMKVETTKKKQGSSAVGKASTSD
ncbi:hypothetical protein RF11_09539 [Thelohanellus kitauei]|uniref:Uncharacterized protein n=1 Tax=Thelohanellus kitauei TaxID=669202 RepID=A0A0C2J236_THEKT|nr:hypothetical protein RF11_09539 [Thelohanellus kitauei]